MNKPWFANYGGTRQNSDSMILNWQPPQLNGHLGFINPGLTLVYNSIHAAMV